jgi:hypothetical protein
MLRSLMALSAFLLLFHAATARAQCGPRVCAYAGVDQPPIGVTQRALNNALLSSLSGAEIDLSISELTALASGAPELTRVLAAFQASSGAASAIEALRAPLGLRAAIDALGEAAQAAGLSAAASALDKLSGALATLPASAQIRLSDVLSVDTNASLDGVALPLLELVKALFETYNEQHAATVNRVTIAGGLLGLPPSVASVELAVLSRGRPRAACGAAGATLRAPGQRISMRLNLVDLDIALSLGLASTSVELAQLELVADVAPGVVVLDGVDAGLAGVVADVTPGFTAIFLGHVADEVLLDQRGTIDFDSEVAPSTLGDLTLRLVGGTEASAALLVESRASRAAGETSLTFAAPYPATESVQSQDFSTLLGAQLLANLTLRLAAPGSGLGLSEATLNALLAQLLVPLQSTLGALLGSVLGGVMGPALDTLGSGQNELDVTVWAPAFVVAGAACDDNLFCTAGDVCDGAGACVGGSSPCLSSGGASCTAQACLETQDRCQSELVAGCLIAASCFGAGARNPGNACEACLPAQSTDSFRPDLAGCDSDGDGVMDAYEQSAGGSDLDSDGDHTPDRFDADDDGDSLPSASEAPDPNGDGHPADARDSDGDGRPDYLDPDDDDDGLTSDVERKDSGARGSDDPDGDGRPTWLDDDSDGDGATDRQEGRTDADGDGAPDYLDADTPTASPVSDGGMTHPNDLPVDAAGPEEKGPTSPDAGADVGEDEAGADDGAGAGGPAEGAEPVVKFQLEGGAGCSLHGRSAPSASWCGLLSLSLLARARRRRALARC